jgi:photosystem II stability/assembly factor-like uncharacterized protein
MARPRASGDGKYVYAIGSWLEAGVPKRQILRSSDLGTGWCVLPSDEAIVDVVPSGPGVLYATTEGTKLFQTSDGGATWLPRVRPGAAISPVPLVVAADEPNVVWIVDDPLYVSVDAAANWTSPTIRTSSWSCPATPGTSFASSARG